MGKLTQPLSTIPLSFETRVNQPMQWRTNNVLRMRLHETLTAQTIGSYINENLSGNLGVGAFSTINVTRPWSLLHLDNGGNQVSGYRPWHRPGMTITNGTDLGWIGLKNEGGDVNHMTIAWADNTAVQGPDLLKAIFLANPGTTGTAGTLNGLETFRILPAVTGNQSFFGIGDFFTPTLNPTERLHVLNGRVRIQALPDDPQTVDAFQVMVVDNTNDPLERGVVKWVPAASIVSVADCEWSMTGGTNPGDNDVWTAVGGETDNCPDETEAVGIGTSSPTAKLHVNAVSGFGTAIRAEATQATTTNTGLLGSVSGGTTSNLGVDLGVSGGSTANTGLRASVSGSTSNNTGINATVRGSANGTNNGVYADVTPQNGVNMDYANGVVANVTGPSIGASGIYGNVQLTQAGNAAAQMHGVYGNVRASAGNYQYVYGTRGGVSSSGATIDRIYGAYGAAGGNSTMNASYGLWGLSQVSGVVSSNYGAQATAYWEQGATVNQSIGLRATSEPVLGVTTTVPLSYGVIAAGRAGLNRTYGVYSTGWGGGANDYGVYGSAAGGTTNNFSIYGDFAGNGATDYAGYFNGRTHINGVASCPAMAWTSDASIKTDVEDISGATELLAQVQPRSYRFLTEEYPTMNLPEGDQLGVIAQELEQVLPGLVHEIHIAASLDTAGQEISPATTIKGVNYIGLIPLLISAVQEQTARIEALENDLASCCDSQPRGASSVGGPEGLETDLRIIPNPVADQTELRYTVGTAGRVRLEITDASGRAIQLQEEGMRSTGTFSFGWDTTLLAPGTYFCTLYVNDEPLVKKAVKLSAR